MVKLIITEKPSVCRKFKYYLLGNNAESHNYGKNVTYYSGKMNGEKTVITPLRGHVYTVSYPDDTWKYPDIRPKDELVLEVNKGCHNYVNAVEKILEKFNVKEIYSAGDVDIEGSALIGNLLRKKGNLPNDYTPSGSEPYNYKRMHFSALTKREITNAYDNPNKYDSHRTQAGYTRSVIDIEVGFNITRALTQAVRNTGTKVKVLSSGRVQGPTLSILYDKYKAIDDFTPTSFWRLISAIKGNKDDFELTYFDKNAEGDNKDRIWGEDTVEKIKKECESVDEVEIDIEKETKNDYPYPPFNLTTLQKTANKAFGFSPSKTKKIAEDLYNQGFCSYPRTSSNKWPQGYFNKKYMKNKLKEVQGYSSLADDVELALDNFRWPPITGKSLDEAHPPLHPVQAPGKELKEDKDKIFRLISKAFIASFCPNAKIENTKVMSNIKGHDFKETGNILKEKGYRKVYLWAKKVKSELPEITEGVYTLKEISKEESQTKPPQRFSQTRLVGAMEDENLGTKATRDNIVNKLQKRKYYSGKKKINLTGRGKAIGRALKKYVPKLVSPEFTSEFQEDLNDIEAGNKEYDKVINSYLEEFEEIFKEFKEKEEKIGKEIANEIEDKKVEIKTEKECPECGGNLIIREGQYGFFKSCDNYPDCEYTTYIEAEDPCPKCEKGELEFRNGPHGAFLACSKCDFTKNIPSGDD